MTRAQHRAASLTSARAASILLKMPPATVLFDLMGRASLVPGEEVQVIRINVVLARTAVPVLLLSATSFPASAQALPLRSVALEADALAYAVNGYSGVLRVSLANGLNIALGAGR